MKLQVLEGEKFSCQSCTECCRSWHVVLMAGEAERIKSLQWGENDPLRRIKVLLEHRGTTYTAHNKDTGCVFLNLANGRCRIHEQFGVDAKPLGCRVFPFQISPTFEGEASVIGRFDCPTVRKNQGETHRDQLGDLRLYASRMELSGGFDEATRCHLSREQIEAVVEFILTLSNAFSDDARRALFIVLLCNWIATMQAEELDRETLGKMFGPLKQEVDAAMDLPNKRPGPMQRLSFRTLLGLYVRRDEDVLNGRASRIGRTMAMNAVVMGFGRFDRLGLSHPPGKLRRAKLFQSTLQPHEPTTFALFWRMVRNRLESFQFMAAGNSGRDFLSGLRSLALLYPLTAAVAKYSAANRGAKRIETLDVDYAVSAIEHSFGRLAVLNTAVTRSPEKLLVDPVVFARLVRNI